MATRPTWQGYLRLSLVSCPVALYTATQRTSDVSFNMLHRQTLNRIRMIPTDPETGPVDRADIVKGYEVEKGQYVVVTDDEIENVKTAAGLKALPREALRNLAGALPRAKPTDAKLATRAAGRDVLQPLAAAVPLLFGGSADLYGSTLNYIAADKDFDKANRAAFFFGEPQKVFWVVVDWFASGEIFPHLGITLLETADLSTFAPVETIEGALDGGLIVLCDHASNAMPAEYASLGLPPNELQRHIAYDIGIAETTRHLARLTGAPAVLSTFSRLLIDPNRGEDDPTLVMRLSDGAIVPGNARADEAEVECRAPAVARTMRSAGKVGNQTARKRRPASTSPDSSAKAASMPEISTYFWPRMERRATEPYLR